MNIIKHTLERYSKALANKNWNELSHVLSDELIVDFKDLFNFTGKQSPNDFIKKRKQSFDDLTIYHLLTPLKVGVSGNKALCKAYSIVYRLDKFHYFNSHADYVFGLVKKDENWVIRSIKQSIIWNDGKLRYK